MKENTFSRCSGPAMASTAIVMGILGNPEHESMCNTREDVLFRGKADGV